jgi:cell wall integrity and stress response component
MQMSTLFASTLVVAWQAVGVLAADCEVFPPVQSPIATPHLNELQSQGCFNDRGNLTETDLDSTGLSSGSCREYCQEHDYWVSALHIDKCFCGFMYPPEDALVDDKKCDFACPGFCPEACGSLGNPGHYSVFNLGIEVNVEFYVPEVTTTSSSATATPTESSPTTDESSVPVTSAPAPSDDEEKSKTNVGGIVAGSVVGVAAVLGLAGGAFWFMRRRRNSEIEEEHRRNAAVNAFISGSKPPGSSGSISMTDSRLDPIMAHRRMSDGSIADNEDYSRKILRVTNA